MWTKFFWLSLAERAIKTAAQTSLVLITGDVVNLVRPDWRLWALVVGVPTLVSVLTSLGSAKVGPAGSPGLVSTPLESGALTLAARARGLVVAAVPAAVSGRIDADLGTRIDRTREALDAIGQLKP